MAQTLKLKRSAVSGNAPSTSDLALGEIAINTYDGKIFIKKDDGTESIVTFEAGGSSNAGTIEEDSFTGNGNTTAFTISTAPSTEENLLVFIDAAFQNRDSFTVSGTTVTFDTAPDNGSSVRIYHVIPGTLDDGILTVAKFAANTLVTEAEGISSNDNDTTIPTSAAVKDYVDTQVATVDTLPEVLANGNTTGGTDIAVSAADDITFADSSKAIFGTDSDLELYHNGSNAFLTNTTGDLYIQDTNGSIRIRPKTGESGIDVLADGAVNLYYDNTSVLSTTADGISVTSEVEADEFIGDLRGAVLFKAQAGENVTKGDVVYISGISGNTTVVSKADADDASKMPAFGIVAVTTTSGQPVDIYTQGILGSLDTSAYSEGDELFVSTTAGALTNTPPTGETAAIQKIAKVTRSNASAGSIFITGAGRSNATPNLDEDQFFLGNASNQAVATDFSDAVEALSINNVVEDTTPQLGGDLASNGNDILFADSDKSIFGTGSDLQIYHDGTHSYLDDQGTGDLRIKTNFFRVRNSGDTYNMIIADQTGAVTLYHNGNTKLATTSTGINVTGEVLADSLDIDGNGDISGNLTLGGYLAGPATFTIDPAAVGDNTGTVVIAGNLQVDGTTTTINSTTLTVDDKLITLASGSANAAAANGAGIEVEISGATNPSLTYDGTNDEWDFNKDINITGTVTADGLKIDATNYYINLNSYIDALPADNDESHIFTTSGTGSGFFAKFGALGISSRNKDTASSDIGFFTDKLLRAEITDGGNISFYEDTGTTAKFFWDASNERLGIGTTSPTSPLTIKSSSFSSANSGILIQANGNTNNIIAMGEKSTDGGRFHMYDGGVEKIAFYTDGTANHISAGNVGIGTASPASPLHIKVAGTGGSNILSLENDSNKYDFRLSGSDLLVRDGSLDRIALDSSGNVGIGTSSPLATGGTAKLSVIGILSVGLSNSDMSYIRRQSAGNYAWQTYDNNNTGSIQLQPYGGSVGIGNTSPSAKLQVEEYGIDTTETSTTATTQVAIHTMSATAFRSARFTVQVTNSTDSTYHLTEILMIHDGTTPSITEYGTIFTGSAEATFDADISSGNVRLLATPASTDTMEFKVVAHSITT